ncbi:unnamed protein product [Camellia sinensis]
MLRKKELDSMRAQMLIVLAECVDLVRFILEAISEVFPVDKSFMIISFPELSLICSSTFSTPKVVVARGKSATLGSTRKAREKKFPEEKERLEKFTAGGLEKVIEINQRFSLDQPRENSVQTRELKMSIMEVPVDLKMSAIAMKINNSIVESISGVDISPDDVVGVIGQKQFWKARRAILLPDHEETYNHEVLPSPPCKRAEFSFSEGIGRTYKKFSFEEMKKLIEGVEKYGGNYCNWKTIKKLYFEDSDRSKDQLKGASDSSPTAAQNQIAQPIHPYLGNNGFTSQPLQRRSCVGPNHHVAPSSGPPQHKPAKKSHKSYSVEDEKNFMQEVAIHGQNQKWKDVMEKAGTEMDENKKRLHIFAAVVHVTKKESKYKQKFQKWFEEMEKEDQEIKAYAENWLREVRKVVSEVECWFVCLRILM